MAKNIRRSTKTVLIRRWTYLAKRWNYWHKHNWYGARPNSVYDWIGLHILIVIGNVRQCANHTKYKWKNLVGRKVSGDCWEVQGGHLKKESEWPKSIYKNQDL